MIQGRPRIRLNIKFEAYIKSCLIKNSTQAQAWKRHKSRPLIGCPSHLRPKGPLPGFRCLASKLTC